ncbi:hypothetical protein [Streptomyces sp. NPDC057702]|uniref:hypothetical protein n=1 Tax=unclassified Streptomyces TaxID=2593676 RepID=UPI0036BAF43C
MGLTEECARTRAGHGDPAALLGEFRRALVLVPLVRGGLLSGVYGGIRWIHAFTDEGALTRFLLARGQRPTSETEYAAMRGARLLDAVIPRYADGPCGVALDVADPDQAMFLPPMVGVVPDEVALDAAPPEDRERARPPGRDRSPRDQPSGDQAPQDQPAHDQPAHVREAEEAR